MEEIVVTYYLRVQMFQQSVSESQKIKCLPEAAGGKEALVSTKLSSIMAASNSLTGNMFF